MSDTLVIDGDVSLLNVLDGDASLVDRQEGQGGAIVVPSGYIGSDVPRMEAQTITPTTQSQTVETEGKYLLGDLTVNPIPSQYEVYNWMGSRAEYVSTVYDVTQTALKDTSFNGWSPSTTAKTIKSSANATTFVADLTQYEYLLVWEFEFDAAYVANTVPKSAPHRICMTIYQWIIKRPNSAALVASGTFSGNGCATTRTMALSIYYGSSGSLAYSYSASYGIYAAATAATFSDSSADNPTVTVKTPSVSARCSTTYMTTGMAGNIDQTNSKFRIRGKLYRMKIGAPERSMTDDVIYLYNHPMTV